MNRRYDIDWVRVIAMGLLLIYHVAIAFQSWGIMIGFITSSEAWPALWTPMTMLNVWRIPLLFFVSGMGVYFAIQNRSWLQLTTERAKRIFIPYLFGFFCIVPLHLFLFQNANNFELNYIPNPGHLWFLGNILCYVLILSPVFFYMKRNEHGKFMKMFRAILSNPAGLLLVILPLVAEVVILKPYPYEMYAMTWHGFVLGLLAFFFGFSFMIAGEGFWTMITKWRYAFVILAATLYGFRLMYFNLNPPQYLIPFESVMWIVSIFAFAKKYLNHESAALKYLSPAAYPVYILHMIFLSLGSILIFKLDIAVQLQFVLVVLFTAAGCMLTYEFVVKRINVLRLLFGLPVQRKKRTMNEQTVPTLL